MNRLFYFLSLLLLFPGIIFAKVNYIRSVPDPSVSSSIVVDITTQDYDADINCGGLKFWGIQAIEHETGNRFSGNPRFVSSTVMSQIFTLDLPLGDYEEITFICSDNGEDEAFQLGSLENDLAGDQVIFSAQAISVSETKKDSLLDKALGFFLGLIGVDNTATSTDVSTTATATSSLANVISALDDTASTTSNNSSAATSTEKPADTVIVSDTNAPSLTSPLSGEIATSTAPEAQSATSSITADANTNGTTTTTF